MNARTNALISCACAGIISALLILQAGGNVKIAAIGFGIAFLKDVQSTYAAPPVDAASSVIASAHLAPPSVSLAQSEQIAQAAVTIAKAQDIKAPFLPPTK